ncbi:carbohydrate kinase family protein [Acidovorax sp. SUPP1855]|uniref:carbohydrate kinase family protein n=1 Tax=Acidovorax sp. SUPP1855 TaxID=431774 RepID=UPI0023DE32C7|nr:carbohydrate kinase family protein [Acidovorax sp. SUPP1855]GKS84309.1 carbohydrate kinase family protein [Acidovorax sp. SUPP1855]
MRVLTIGGATLDIVVAGLGAMRGPGAKHDVASVQWSSGGGAVNAALGFAAFHAQVTACCAVGADVEGRWLSDTLDRQGIAVERVQTIPGCPTGKAVIHLDPQGDATVFAQRGASTRLSLADASAMLMQAELVYVSALADAANDELNHALAGLPSRSFQLVVNPGARSLRQSPDSLERLLQVADLVCLNAIEAQWLAAHRFVTCATEMDAHEAVALAAALARRQGQGVLVTLGAGGAVFFDGLQGHHHPAERTTVVSTLGAGDAYASAFAFHWFSGHGARASLEAANRRAVEVLGVAAANLATLVM